MTPGEARSNLARSVRVGAPIVFVVAVFGCALLPGHWRPSWNAPWLSTNAPPETAASWRLGQLESQDERFIGLAISGGGSRAANFGAAVMLELEQRGLLQQVDVMSGVSGGALPITYYVLSPEKSGAFTEPALRETFGSDLVRPVFLQLFNPKTVFLRSFTDFSESDLLVDSFDAHLFHGARFSDLKPYPKLLISATLLNTVTRFTFTDEAFHRLQSNLAQYSVASAVSTSAAVPGVVDAVTLEKYGSVPEYLQLVDGGMIDNLGVEAVLEFLYRNLIGREADKIFGKGCLILLVDASPGSYYGWLAYRESNRSFVDYLVNTHALEGSDALFLTMRERALRALGVGAPDAQIVGEVPLLDRHQCMCQFRHIALRHLAYSVSDEVSPELVQRVLSIPTSLSMTKMAQDDLFYAAKLLMRELEEAHLLPEQNMGLKCKAA